MTRDRTLLRHILDAMDAVELYVADGESAFLADRKTQDAVARNHGITGEAVKLLFPDLTSRHPDVPWRQIAGLRDRLIHQYFNVSLPLVWNAAFIDFPQLRHTIVQNLADEQD